MNPPFASGLENLSKWLQTARARRGLTQRELAARTAISQSRLSAVEQGLYLPTLRQLIRLARALAVPLQWFLNGATVPGEDLAEIAFELQNLGVADLLVAKPTVPGAFRPTEQVIALAVSGNEPEPRVIEAIPAVLSWNPWSPSLLSAYSRQADPRAEIRIAWLADVALTIQRNEGFPGGCPQRRTLESFVRRSSRKVVEAERFDDLGRQGTEESLPPVSRRWKIGYDAPVSVFADRAHRLQSLREPGHRQSAPPAKDSNE